MVINDSTIRSVRSDHRIIRIRCVRLLRCIILSCLPRYMHGLLASVSLFVVTPCECLFVSSSGSEKNQWLITYMSTLRSVCSDRPIIKDYAACKPVTSCQMSTAVYNIVCTCCFALLIFVIGLYCVTDSYLFFIIL